MVTFSHGSLIADNKKVIHPVLGLLLFYIFNHYCFIYLLFLIQCCMPPSVIVCEMTGYINLRNKPVYLR